MREGCVQKQVAVGRDGAVFATGYTRSPFPTVGTFGSNNGAAFVTRMEGVGEAQVTGVPPVFTRESVVMAPSGVPSVMRGSWISIYGRNFLPRGGTVVAETLPLPTELAGVSVSFNGHAGRILSISSTSEGDQINVQVPARCTLGGRRGNGGISMDDPERRWW